MTTGSRRSTAARCVVGPGMRPSARCSRRRAMASRSVLVRTLCEKQHTIVVMDDRWMDGWGGWMGWMDGVRVD